MKTVNDYITRIEPDVEVIIQGVTPGSCMARDYFKGTLGDVPESSAVRKFYITPGLSTMK